MAEKNNKKSVKPKTVNESAEKKVAVKKKVVVRKQAVSSEVKAEKSPVVDAKKKPQMKVPSDAIYATGRRKESTAKVWLFKGTGEVKVNRLDPLEYLNSSRLVNRLMTPLNALSLNGKYDVRIDVSGGGMTGQAEASTLGLSRAVLTISEDFKTTLRADGLLTQDRREKERKKYGKRGARKSPQFRKR
jgi:small subunit ribosomal protein S9